MPWLTPESQAGFSLGGPTGSHRAGKWEAKWEAKVEAKVEAKAEAGRLSGEFPHAGKGEPKVEARALKPEPFEHLAGGPRAWPAARSGRW